MGSNTRAICQDARTEIRGGHPVGRRSLWLVSWPVHIGQIFVRVDSAHNFVQLTTCCHPHAHRGDANPRHAHPAPGDLSRIQLGEHTSLRLNEVSMHVSLLSAHPQCILCKWVHYCLSVDHCCPIRVQTIHNFV